MADERNNKVNVSSDKQLTTEYVRHKRLIYVSRFLFLMYMITAIYFLLFSESMGRNANREYRYNLELFKEINRFIEYRHELGGFAVFANLFGNILIFVPFGFFLPMGSRRRSFLGTTWNSFLLSLGVEVFQLFTKVGSFDVDDLLLNTLGGILGYLLFVFCNAVRRRYFAKKRK